MILDMGNVVPVDSDGNFELEGNVEIVNYNGKETLLLLSEDVSCKIKVRKLEEPKNTKICIGDEEIDIESDTIFLREYIGNRIGITKLRIVKSGLDTNLNFDQVMILSRKIPQIYGIDWKFKNIESEKDLRELLKLHDNFCEVLVDDITKRCLELPFSLKAPTGFEFVETEEPISIFFAYHYLVNYRELIESAYETILRLPHRDLLEFSELVDFHEVTDINEDCILDIVRNPERFVEASKGIVVIDKRNYAPTKVLQNRKFETFDNPENRFVKHFLSELIFLCDRVLEEYGNRAELLNVSKIAENLGKLMELRDTLELFWNDPIFRDVGEMIILPMSSQVLLKREGYRDVLDLWLRLRSYVPFFGDLEEAIANKDIPTLYEYWCFFKLIKELEEILGECRYLESPVSPEAEIEGKTYAEFDNRWTLYYNKYFKGYSQIGLKPDFALCKGQVLKGVFDAKFKLDVDFANLREKEEFYQIDNKFSRRPTFRTWAKIEDIYKMHLYRDALEIDFAVILYPGDLSEFFKLKRGTCVDNVVKDFKLADLFRRDKKDIRLKGIGYLSFKPNV